MIVWILDTTKPNYRLESRYASILNSGVATIYVAEPVSYRDLGLDTESHFCRLPYSDNFIDNVNSIISMCGADIGFVIEPTWTEVIEHFIKLGIKIGVVR